MTMDGQCHEFQELFSPVLDGVADAAEKDRLLAHLDQCARCREEFAEWQRISHALRASAPAFEVEAPPDFVRQVMSRLEPVQSSPASPSFTWRKPMPMTAAAALVLFLAGAALYQTMGPSPSPSQLAILDPQQQGVTGQEASPSPQPSGTQMTNAGQAADPSSGKEAAGSASPADAAGPAGSQAGPQREPSSQPSPLQPNPAAMALLSSDLLIESTMVKLDVSNVEAAAGAARQAVAAYGGSAVTVAGEQQSPAILRLTVAKEKAQALIGHLKALGTLKGSPVPESRNVTAAYQKAQSRIQEILALAAKDPARADQYRNELAALERQLSEWKKEAGQHVVILWLE